jgi:hypothetical protein
VTRGLAIALIATAVVCAGCDLVFPQQPQVIYLIPEGFSGWTCLDFEVKSAQPLPREGGTPVVRVQPGVILETSDSDDEIGIAYSIEVWIESGGQRRALTDTVSVRRTLGMSGPNEPHQRTCRFIGTVDQQDAAADPPGFETGWFASRPIPDAERAALIALFKSAGGEQWKHKVGWLGPPGTECKWHGVTCKPVLSESTTNVIGLDLFENNLSGVIPGELAALNQIEQLNLYDSALTGRLPAPLIQRWLAGEIEIVAPSASWLTDVTEIRLESSPTGSIGGWQRIVFNADNRAAMFSERLRNLSPLDRTTYCEVKEGRIFDTNFARLAHVIERNQYYSLKPEYQRSVTHAAFEITTVVRNGTTHRVSDYASAGPLELWTVRQAIAGAAEDAWWEKTTRQPNCPSKEAP